MILIWNKEQEKLSAAQDAPDGKAPVKQERTVLVQDPDDTGE